jgi:hypothetical protein
VRAPCGRWLPGPGDCGRNRREAGAQLVRPAGTERVLGRPTDRTFEIMPGCYASRDRSRSSGPGAPHVQPSSTL